MVRVGYYGVRTNRQVTLGNAWWTIFKQNAAYARKAGVWGWSAYALGAVGAASRLAWFGNMVRSNGRWDLKRRLDYRNSYHFAGKWRRHDDIGNLMYGFVGRAYGPSLTTLQGAGGIAQIIARTSKWSFWKTYFDDPRDSAAVREGYNLYASTPRASYNGVIYVAWL